MKRSSLAALILAFAPIALIAQAPAHHDSSMPAKSPAPPSKLLKVDFGNNSITLTVDQLLQLPQTTVHVHNAHRNTDETYSGPLVSFVLAKAGLIPTHENEVAILHSNIIATGTDHYFVLYSGAEVEPEFSTGKVIVAIMKSGLPNTEGGLIQLINTGDSKPARWIHSLANLNVMTLTPIKK